MCDIGPHPVQGKQWAIWLLPGQAGLGAGLFLAPQSYGENVNPSSLKRKKKFEENIENRHRSKKEKVECPRTDAFELWCWKRLLRVPWTARRSNQSILKEISPEYSLEGLMLKLKLQYFGHLIGRTYSLEKTLMLGKIEGGRKRGQQRMRCLDGITDSMDVS